MNGARFARWIASGFGAGYLPIAPGTWGSLLAVAVAIFLAYFIPQWYLGDLLFLVGLTSVAGVISASSMARQLGDDDPSAVVIDEISGQFLTLLWVPAGPAAWFWGFLLFRLFDIVKPFPARQSERLPGGWGIMADDWIAGFYAGALLFVLHRLMGLF